jgi:hypothetical protein
MITVTAGACHIHVKIQAGLPVVEQILTILYLHWTALWLSTQMCNTVCQHTTTIVLMHYSGLWCSTVVYVVTNVSEEHNTSIFTSVVHFTWENVDDTFQCQPRDFKMNIMSKFGCLWVVALCRLVFADTALQSRRQPSSYSFLWEA